MRNDTTRLKWEVAAVATAFLVIVIYVLIATGIFDATPTVEVQAHNCYTETIRVVTDEDYSPYSFYDKNGMPTGHDVELINMIANTVGKNLELELLPWNEALSALESGEADVLMTCDRSDVFTFDAQPIKTGITAFDEYVVYSKHRVDDMGDLFSGTPRVGFMANGNAEDVLDKMGALDQCIGYDTNKNILLAIDSGELDAGIMRNAIGATLLDELNLKTVKPRLSIDSSCMCFAVNPDKQELASEIDGAIHKLRADGQLGELSEKWLTTFVKSESVADVLANRPWIVLVFGFMVIALTVSQIVGRKTNEHLSIIKALTKDFECVVYFTQEENKEEDTILFRNDRHLVSAIPSLGTVSTITKYLDQLINHFVVPEDRENVYQETRRENIISRLEKKDAFFVHFRGQIGDVTEYYELKFNVVKNAQGNITNCVAGIRNVNEATRNMMRQKEELEQAYRMAEAASVAKTMFLSSMSHDVRTPMNAIIGYTAMAKKNLDDRRKTEDCLNKIELAGNNLIELINQVLEMSRIESGKAELNEKDVDLTEKLGEIISVAESTADAKNISFVEDYSGIRNRFVRVDSSRLTQIMTNILGNAIKYTPEGGTVSVTANQEPGEVPGMAKYCFVVKDTGIGMRPEFLEHVFEEFTRERNSTTSGTQGTGLGMSIVKRLVDLFGGTIGIESEKGKGTTVSVSIPMKIYEKLGDRAETSDVREAVDLKGLKILLVDDNEMNLEIAVEILEESGVKVTTARDGDIAVDVIRNAKPGDFDLVLMDIQMPRMNGYEATRAIRALDNKELAQIPVIAMTANAFDEDRKAAMEAGMNEHIAKPIEIEKMKKTIAKSADADVFRTVSTEEKLR